MQALKELLEALPWLRVIEPDTFLLSGISNIDCGVDDEI